MSTLQTFDILLNSSALASMLFHQLIVFDEVLLDPSSRVMLILIWSPPWLHLSRWSCLDGMLFGWYDQAILTIFQDPHVVASLRLGKVSMLLFMVATHLLLAFHPWMVFTGLLRLPDRGVNDNINHSKPWGSHWEDTA